MSTNSEYISNDTEGVLVDVIRDTEDLVYGYNLNIEQQLYLADLLAFAAKRLYSDVELYGNKEISRKFNIIKNMSGNSKVKS